MKKNKMILIASLCCSSNLVMAMQPLDDQSLALTTGQDGINIGLSTEKINFNEVSLIDNNGLNSSIMGKDYKGRAAYTIAGTQNSPVSVQFVGANSDASINMAIDTDGGNGKAFTNIAVGFGQNISAIKISPFSVYFASAGSVSSLSSEQSIFSASGTLNADVKKILNIGSESNQFEISFQNTNKPQVNIQLGNVPQSHMIQFSGAIQSICGTGSGCPIMLVSGNTGAQFDLQMKATNSSTGFLLNGLHAGVTPDGMVLGQEGVSSKMNIALNNVTLGTSGAISPTVFNGVANGSMGSFGAVGVSVKDLKINIRGL
ncbi:FilA [Acinetobacter sp. 194]|uniref:DUF6160 family protein n=1 Tax=Acinetobacter shaoyimingii TaxID=2715164 RepID=UPI00140BB0F8|nr:DUF6160 family protein [Acinetobacter shaoyimingii]NHB57614.1 FilA [Acinetobacter shaoyimingii]